MPPRGIRLNNPGNIRHGAKWLGLTGLQDDPDFCRFSTPTYGIRAMMVLLHTYAGRKQDTVRTIVSHWAPPSENDTIAYIKCVDAAVPGGPDDHLNLSDEETSIAVVQAIIQHEQGQQPYIQTLFSDAFKLANLV